MEAVRGRDFGAATEEGGACRGWLPGVSRDVHGKVDDVFSESVMEMRWLTP